MSLALTICTLILAWLAVAGAMLWGVLRIARRHHSGQPTRAATPAAVKPRASHATAH